jgi:hypothetical protein
MNPVETLLLILCSWRHVSGMIDLKMYQGNVARAPIPDNKVSWTVEWPDYKPVDYTSPRVLKGPVWADPDFSR